MAANRGQGGQKPGMIATLVGVVGLVAIPFIGLMMFFSVADPTIDGMTRFVLWILIYFVVHALFAASVVFKIGGIGYKLGERIRAMGHQAMWFFRFFASYWAILVVLIGVSSFIKPLWWIMLQPVTLIASIALMPYLATRAANMMDAGATLRTANTTNTAGRATQAPGIATESAERPTAIHIDNDQDITATRPTESLADRIYQRPPEPERLDLGPSPLRPDMPDVSGWDKDKQ